MQVTLEQEWRVYVRRVKYNAFAVFWLFGFMEKGLIFLSVLPSSGDATSVPY